MNRKTIQRKINLNYTLLIYKTSYYKAHLIEVDIEGNGKTPELAIKSALNQLRSLLEFCLKTGIKVTRKPYINKKLPHKIYEKYHVSARSDEDNRKIEILIK